MDTAWSWELPGYCAKYSFLTESKGLTMREVERIFQLDSEPPVLENMNDYIIEAVRSRELRWFSFFLHCYENRLNGRVRCFLLREGLDRYDPVSYTHLDVYKRQPIDRCGFCVILHLEIHLNETRQNLSLIHIW